MKMVLFSILSIIYCVFSVFLCYNGDDWIGYFNAGLLFAMLAK